MAEAAKNIYGRNAVYGSLAYDFNNPELYPEIEYSSPFEQTAQPRPGEKVETHTRVKTHAHAKAKQSVAPMAILGMIVAAVLLVITIMAQSQLMSVSAQSVELQSRLTELKSEQTKLKIAYESAFNLTEIEEYATAHLGMQKPTASQVYYIDTSSPDKAVVIMQTNGDGFVDRVSDFISGIGAYFA